MWVGYFLSHSTLKIPSSINKPVSGSKIVEKKKRLISSHGWLVNILYCISYMGYHFNVCFSSVQTDAFLTVYVWCCGLVSFLWHHAIRFHGSVESIATRFLPHRKRLDNVDAEFFLPCSQLLNLIFPSHKNEVKSCSKIRYPAHARVVPFPVNRTLRIFSCFLLANNTLKPVSCLR